jgi:hypothetical protein
MPFVPACGFVAGKGDATMFAGGGFHEVEGMERRQTIVSTSPAPPIIMSLLVIEALLPREGITP